MNDNVGKSPAVVSVIANVEDKKFYYNKKLYCGTRLFNLWSGCFLAYIEWLGDQATVYRQNKELAGIMS
jgi:hypothetical protein